MTLLKNDNNEDIVEILQKDSSSEKMKIRLYLDEIPDKNWSTIFNRMYSKIESYSVQESRAIIVLIERIEYEKNNFIQEVIDKINKTNIEIAADIKKRNIFKSVLKPGIVVVHDGLSFEGDESQLEKFLKQNVNNYIIE